MIAAYLHYRLYISTLINSKQLYRISKFYRKIWIVISLIICSLSILLYVSKPRAKIYSMEARYNHYLAMYM